MTRVAETIGRFADVLRSAIDARGLGLERIRDRLEVRGVPLSVATLSYWQSGRRQPERPGSLAALPHLEEVLRLPPGTLRTAVVAHPARGRRCPAQGLDLLWPEEPQARVLAALDTRWDEELDRLSLHDVLTLGPDGTSRRLVVRQVLRARRNGPDRRVVMHTHSDVRAALPTIRALTGCRRGRTVRDADGGVIGTELLFWEPLQRGEALVIEYELLSRPPYPCESEYSRRFRLPVREYVVEVRFHPDALPDTCTTFADPDGEGVPLTLDPTHRVLHVDVDGPAGERGVRWTWPRTR